MALSRQAGELMKRTLTTLAWVFASGCMLSLAKDLWGISDTITFRNIAASVLALLAGVIVGRVVKV